MNRSREGNRFPGQLDSLILSIALWSDLSVACFTLSFVYVFKLPGHGK